MPNWEQIASEIAEQAAKALKGERKKFRIALAAAAVFLAAGVVGWIV